MLRTSFLVLTLCLLSSCGSATRPAFVVSLVTPDGRDPLAGIINGTITIQVRQEDETPLMETEEIAAGNLDAIDVRIASYGAITRIEVVIEDDSNPLEPRQLIGASPPFVPVGYDGVTVVMGEPQSCAPLAAASLTTARVQPGLVSLDANMVSIGGEENDGSASTAVDSFSLAELTETVDLGERPDLVGVGAGGAMRLGSDGSVGVIGIIALSELRGAILYYLDQAHLTGDAVPDVDLVSARPSAAVHLGIGPSSTLVDLGAEVGVAIVGGRQGDAPVAGITWVDIDGLATTSMLSTPRIRPAAVRLGQYVLVAGGQAEGEALFELVSIAAPHTVRSSFGEGEPSRRGAVLVAEVAGTRAWLGFGEDESGALLDTTYLVTNCPSDCVFEASDPIEHPRSGFALARRATEVVVAGGMGPDGLTSKVVERIRLASGAVSIDPMGMLSTARDRAGAAPMAQGIVLVAGGQVESGGSSTDLRPLDDFEICFPDALDLL